MAETASSILSAWSNFYITTGSSAAALTGLMFIVITLVMGSERPRRNPDGIGTYSPPPVVHFCAALLVSAILSAPWRSLALAGAFLGLTGLAGVFYVLRVMFRTRRLIDYKPDAEDWTWYTILPSLAYVAILAGAIALPPDPVVALFVIAGGAMLLIFIGIRNAWDIVTFIAIGGFRDLPNSSRYDQTDRSSQELPPS